MLVSAHTRALGPDPRLQQNGAARRGIDPDRYQVGPVFERPEDRNRQSAARRPRQAPARPRDLEARASDLKPAPSVPRIPITSVPDIWVLLSQATATAFAPAPAPSRAEQPSLDDLFAKAIAQT